MGVDFFEVTCGLGGTFLPPEFGWPLCDTVSPAKCDQYPPPPDIVELMSKHILNSYQNCYILNC